MPNSVQIELTVPVPTVIASFHVRQIAGDGGGTGPVSWDSITGKPSAFTPVAHGHGWDEITDKPTTFTPSAHTHEWDSITGKPTEFTPSAHSHNWDSITGKPTEFTPATHSHSWSVITDKPTEFTPASHTHTVSQISDFAASVRATILTGLAAGANAIIAATDTVMEALAKLQAQIDARVLKNDVWRRVITTDSAIGTGSSGVIKLASIEVPAGTFATGTDLLIRSRVKRVSGSLAWSNHVYVNTTDDLSGATLLGIANATSGILANQFKRDAAVKGAQTEIFRTTTSVQTDDFSSSVAFDLVGIDWSVKQYIQFAVNSGGINEQFCHSLGLIEARKSI